MEDLKPTMCLPEDRLESYTFDEIIKIINWYEATAEDIESGKLKDHMFSIDCGLLASAALRLYLQKHKNLRKTQQNGILKI